VSSARDVLRKTAWPERTFGAGGVPMLASRLIRTALILPWFVLYAWLAWRAVSKRPGTSLRAKAEGLFRLREPSIYLDSARVFVFSVWLFNTPDPGALKETLTRSLPLSSPIGLFKLIPLASVPLWSVDAATWLFRAAILVALLGLATRAGSAIAAVCHIFLWSLQFSFGYSVHNHVVPMALLTIALCPDPSPFIGKYVQANRDKKPLTEVASYPAFTIEAVRFAFVTVYVQAGMEKALQSGLRYFNGTTLQTHFLWGFQKITKASVWPLWLLGLIAFLVVMWECAFGLIHFFPKVRIPFTLSAIFFHEIVRHTMSINPFTFLESGILFFIPPMEIALLWRGKSAPRAEPEEAPSQKAPSRGLAPTARAWRAFVAATLAVGLLQWAPFFLRRGAYPLLSFSLFSGAYSGGEVQPRGGFVQVRAHAGDAWRPIDETKSLAMPHIAFGEFLSSRFAPYFFKDQALSMPGYAKQDEPRDLRESQCQWLLGEVRKHTYPDANELSVVIIYYVVGELDERQNVVYECQPPTATALLSDEI